MMASRARIVVVAAVAVTTAAAAPSFCAGGDGWSLAWEDEFLGTQINSANWNVVTTTAPGDSSCREALCTPANVHVSNGTLILLSNRTGANNWTTGAVNSQGKQNWMPSPTFRACISAILPGAGGDGLGQGIWPAHWMMPDYDICWPDGGEMDILEMVDGNGTAWGTYHWQMRGSPNCSYPKGAKDFSMGYKMPADWGTAFHEYAVERSTTYIAFVYDGVTIVNRSVDPTDPNAPVLHNYFPWYMILNTAVGGPWPKPPTNVTANTTHVIDYVRVAVQDS